MLLEEKVLAYKALARQIEALEVQKKELYDQILAEMTSPKIDLPNYRLRKYTRFFISTSLEEARPLEATKLEEVIDKDKLKALHQAGIPVAGVKEVPYVSIAAKPQAPSTNPSPPVDF